MCEVIYANSPKAYHYRAEKVQLLKVESRINPSDFIITVDGDIIQQVDEILDFGPFYRFLRIGKKGPYIPKSRVELQENCLTNQKQADVFEYFKETAAAVSLVAEGGLNILSAQYERIKKCQRRNRAVLLFRFFQETHSAGRSLRQSSTPSA